MSEDVIDECRVVRPNSVERILVAFPGEQGTLLGVTPAAVEDDEPGFGDFIRTDGMDSSGPEIRWRGVGDPVRVHGDAPTSEVRVDGTLFCYD